MPYYSNGRTMQYVEDFTAADAVSNLAGRLSARKDQENKRDQEAAAALLDVLKGQKVNPVQYREIRGKTAPNIQRWLPELPDWQKSDADVVADLGMAGARKNLETGNVGPGFFNAGAFETAFGKSMPAATQQAGITNEILKTPEQFSTDEVSGAKIRLGTQESEADRQKRLQQQPAVTALTNQRKARTGLIGEQTTNTQQRRDPTSPLTERDIKVRQSGGTKPKPSSAEASVADLEKRAAKMEDRAVSVTDPAVKQNIIDQANQLKMRANEIKRKAGLMGGPTAQPQAAAPAGEIEYVSQAEWDALLGTGETEASLNADGIYLEE